MQGGGIGPKDIGRYTDFGEVHPLRRPVLIEELVFVCQSRNIFLATPACLSNTRRMILPGIPRNTHLVKAVHGIPPRRSRSRYMSDQPSHGAIALRLGGCAMAAQYCAIPSHEFPAIPTAPLHHSYFATASIRSYASSPK